MRRDASHTIPARALLWAIAFIYPCMPLRASVADGAARETEWRRLAETPALVRFRELTILKAGAWEEAATVTLEPRLRKAIDLFWAKGDGGAGAMPLGRLEEALSAFDRIRRSPRIAAAILARARRIENTRERYYVLGMFVNHAEIHNDVVRSGLIAALKRPAEGYQLYVVTRAFMSGLPVSRERLKNLYMKTPAGIRKARVLRLGRRLKVDLEDKAKFLRWIEKQPAMLRMP